MNGCTQINRQEKLFKKLLGELIIGAKIVEFQETYIQFGTSPLRPRSIRHRDRYFSRYGYMVMVMVI